MQIAADQAHVDLIPSIGAAARAAIGLDAVALERVRVTLKAYNRQSGEPADRGSASMRGCKAREQER